VNKSTRGFGLLENWLSKKRHKLAKDWICADISAGSILDIGCGMYPAFLESMDRFKRSGIDRQCPGAPEWLDFTVHDLDKAEALPFEDGSFNAVSALALIEHLPPAAAERLTQEVRRVLKENGLLVITTPAYWTDRILRILAVFKLVSRQEIEEHKNLFSERSLRELLSAAGFSDIRTGSFELGMNIYAVARKPGLRGPKGP
jgi:SAM-dependent methyltransferase